MEKPMALTTFGLSKLTILCWDYVVVVKLFMLIVI